MKKAKTRKKLIKECENMLRDILKIERGERCEICKRSGNVGLFHILSKGSHPRLRFTQENILLAHWFPCHNDWHHNYFKARVIEKRIKELRGEDYEMKLKKLNVTAPRLSKFRIQLLYEAYKQILEQL